MTFLYKRNNKKFDTENSKWSIGTTCNCRREELLPKIDPYKEYHFLPKNDNNKINKLKLTYLSTDHISIKTPDPNLLKTIDIIKDNKKSILKLKELNFNSESNSFWAPFTHSNDNDFNMICEGSLEEAENNTKIYDHLKETAECKKDLKEISIYDEYDILKIKSKNTIPDKYVYYYLTDEYILDIDNYKSFITSKGYNCVIE